MYVILFSNELKLICFWRRAQPLAGISQLLWQFSPESNHTAPFVELKEPPQFATLWIFLSERWCSSSFRTVQLWELIWLGFTPKEIAVYEKIVLVAITRTQKETSNTFNSRIRNLFEGYLSHHRRIYTNAYRTKKGYTRFTRSVGKWQRVKRKKKIQNVPDLSSRYKGDRSLFGDIYLEVCFLSFVDKIIWILWVLIRPARFTKSFSQCLAFLPDHSKCLSFLQTLQFFSAKKNVHLRPLK